MQIKKKKRRKKKVEKCIFMNLGVKLNKTLKKNFLLYNFFIINDAGYDNKFRQITLRIIYRYSLVEKHPSVYCIIHAVKSPYEG